MRRFPALLSLVVVLASGIVGCGGGHKTTPSTPATVTISPSPLSLTQGQVEQLVATVKDASGNVLSDTVTFTSSNGTVASVTSSGLVCGGVWDSLTSPVVCNSKDANGNPITGTTTITGSVGGVTGTTAVFVHAKVDTITLTAASSDCQSQGSTNTFTAVACSGAGSGSGGCSRGQNITASTGPFTWTVTPATIATPDTTGLCSTFDSQQQAYPCVITAAVPGQASVSASVNNTVSSPVPFIACPVRNISATDANGNTTASLSSGGTVSLTVNVVDSKGNPVSNAPLTYSSSQPASATVAAAVVTAAAAGASTIEASCTPPGCNTGLYPVYSNSNPFIASVSGSSATTVYVASTTGTSLVPIDTGTNSPGTAVTLPNTPNSMLINTGGSKMVLGSNSGAMVYDIASGGVTNTGLNGTVLAISPDGNTAIISNQGAATVYAYSLANNTVISTFPVAGATHAAFSPDSFRAYIVGGAKLTLWSPNAAPRTFSLSAAANDVDLLAQGSFAFVAGGGTANVSVFATCRSTGAAVTGVATPGVPALIRKVPNGTQMVAADSPNIDVITASTDANTGFDASTAACIPPALTNTVAQHDFTAAGVNSFTPNQLIVTPDSAKAFILASDTGAVLVYDIAGQTTTTIKLGSATGAFTGGVTLDSAFLYVGANDNNVHRIDIKAGADAQSIPISFTPDLVAVRPH